MQCVFMCFSFSFRLVELNSFLHITELLKTKLATLLTIILERPDSDLVQNIDYPAEYLRDFR
jgi:hypothetical protein